MNSSCCICIYMQSIPLSFMKRLETEFEALPLNTVVLTTNPSAQAQTQTYWKIHVEGNRHFKGGWQEFCLHHNLKVGDILVFTYESNCVFHVSVFDPSTACEHTYPICNHPLNVKAKGSFIFFPFFFSSPVISGYITTFISI